MERFNTGLEFDVGKEFFDVALMKTGDILRFADHKEYAWLICRNSVNTSRALNKNTTQLKNYAIENEAVYFDHPTHTKKITDKGNYIEVFLIHQLNCGGII